MFERVVADVRIRRRRRTLSTINVTTQASSAAPPNAIPMLAPTDKPIGAAFFWCEQISNIEFRTCYDNNCRHDTTEGAVARLDTSCH
jgi:hypothetical protein